jgi:hypothetical protein
MKDQYGKVYQHVSGSLISLVKLIQTLHQLKHEFSKQHPSSMDLGWQPYASFERTGLLQFMENNLEDNTNEW